MEDIMTPEQVAQYLQLSTDTIYRLIRGRKLAASRIGRTYRVPRQDLETFLAANSSRAEVRRRMFERVEDIGARNPDVEGDAVLDELERLLLARSPRFRALIDRARESVAQGEGLPEEAFWSAVDAQA